jgi:hypothetical protein
VGQGGVWGPMVWVDVCHREEGVSWRSASSSPVESMVMRVQRSVSDFCWTAVCVVRHKERKNERNKSIKSIPFFPCVPFSFLFLSHWRMDFSQG